MLAERHRLDAGNFEGIGRTDKAGRWHRGGKGEASVGTDEGSMVAAGAGHKTRWLEADIQAVCTGSTGVVAVSMHR
jgi:hypothetical protein